MGNQVAAFDCTRLQSRLPHSIDCPPDSNAPQLAACSERPCAVLAVHYKRMETVRGGEGGRRKSTGCFQPPLVKIDEEQEVESRNMASLATCEAVAKANKNLKNLRQPERRVSRKHSTAELLWSQRNEASGAGRTQSDWGAKLCESLLE